MKNFKTYEDKLTSSTYPGRGIVTGKTPDGKNLVQIYWIMGRSSNSRNRIFEINENEVRTKAFDESKLEDPSLVIYNITKKISNMHIVTNGDQTDTIYKFIKNKDTFENALKTREFEPDPPNFTPRISGIINLNDESYKLSILKTVNNDDTLGQRNFYSYDNFIDGYGHCITTYETDGSPLPSFKGEPYIVKIFNSIDENADKFWEYLNSGNKVSLLVKYININTFKTALKIINKNK